MKVSLEHLKRYCSIRPTRQRRQILIRNLPTYKELLKKRYNALLQDSSIVIERYRELSTDINPPMRRLVRWQLDDLYRVLKPCYFGATRALEEIEEVASLELARKRMEQLKMTLDDDIRELAMYIRKEEGTVQSPQAE